MKHQMSDVTVEHTICFRTAAGEEFGREFEVTLVAEWEPEHDCFELTWLESDGVVLTPSWKGGASPDEAALWDRCQDDLHNDAELVAKAWRAHEEARFEAGHAA
jgi:hypothetical protein